MANKSIITRIKNKVDDLSSWQNSTGVLLNGEIAIVRVPTGATYTNPVTGESEPVVELLMKVGDGVHKFNEEDSNGNPYLPWLSAKASDVYNWAKLSDPTAIPVTINGTPSTIGAYLAQVNTNAANISSNDTDIANLNAKVDVEKVSTAISGAIDALRDSTSGSGNFVKAVTQTNGQISVTMGTIAESELPNISTDKVYLAGASGTTLTAKLNAMAADIASKEGTHDHPYLPDTTKYAASSSIGGPANSADKVNKAVTFKATDGAAVGTSFDGSAAVTVSYVTVGAAAASHTHDDRYYTETEIDAKVTALNSAIDGKAASDHNHDSVYITPAAVDTKINTALGSVLKYKGTKSSTSALPTSDNATGDVWNITNASAATSTLPKVNAGDNVAWNGSSWDVLAGTVDLSSYYTEAEVNAFLAEKSDTDHTHKYAGSDSAGGAATSANKVNKAVTFNKDGQGAASGTTFDGSTARTISYNTIGAAAATHSHAKSEITDFAHNHDDRYYTESEVNALLAEKAADTHSHTISAAAEDDDVVVLTGTSGTNGVSYKATHAKTDKAGTYTKVTVDAYGHITDGDSPTTLAGYGITDAYTKGETNAALAEKAGSSHAHGNITTDGKITAAAVTSASGVVVVGSDNKVQKVTDMSKVRAIIGAGTSSLTIGTDGNTAAAGNHSHSAHEARTTAIESNYVRFANDKLYVGKDGADEIIIFDCGGAPIA